MGPVRSSARPISAPRSGRRAAGIACLTLTVSAAAVLLAGFSANAQNFLHRAGLPLARAARLACRLFLEAKVVGTDTYVCGMTDAMAWAWFPQSSDGTLSDARHWFGRTIFSAVSTMLLRACRRRRVGKTPAAAMVVGSHNRWRAAFGSRSAHMGSATRYKLERAMDRSLRPESSFAFRRPGPIGQRRHATGPIPARA